MKKGKKNEIYLIKGASLSKIKKALGEGVSIRKIKESDLAAFPKPSEWGWGIGCKISRTA